MGVGVILGEILVFGLGSFLVAVFFLSQVSPALGMWLLAWVALVAIGICTAYEFVDRSWKAAAIRFALRFLLLTAACVIFTIGTWGAESIPVLAYAFADALDYAVAVAFVTYCLIKSRRQESAAVSP
jgi:hypothetical protein